MNKIYTLVAVFFSLSFFAQDIPDTKKNIPTEQKQINTDKNDFRIQGVWRIYPIITNQFGNHALADAHAERDGFGTSLALLTYKNFRFGFAYEYESYSVTDASKVGNFRNSKMHRFTGFLTYDYTLNKTIMFVPSIGYGSDGVYQKSGSTKFGHYSGNHFKVGLITDVNVGESLALFAGVHYFNSTYDINTNKAFQDYFGKAQQVQLTLGLKIH